MSLHFLGIRDNHLVRQQSSAGRMPQLPPTETTEEVDSKDVLVQRLLDLANHVQKQDLPDEALSKLHHDVDHMERTWQKRPKSPISRARAPLQSFSSTLSTMTNGSTAQEDQFWRPLSPGLESPIRFAFHSPKHSVSKRVEQQKPAVTPLHAALLANEADALLSRLIKVVSELKTRHQESEVHRPRQNSRLKQSTCSCSRSCFLCIGPADTRQHIHDLLVARAEKAALRVTELEERIADLYVHFNTLSECFFVSYQHIFPDTPPGPV